MVVPIDMVVQVLLRERPRLVAVAAAIVCDVHAADDVFQQVVLSALEHKNEIRDQDHLISWAVRVTRHRAVDFCRHRQAQPLPSHVLDLLEASWGDPAKTPGGSTDKVEALRRCVSMLGEQARELLRLKYVEGLSTADLAGRLRRSVEAIYQSLSRLHRALRQCVDREPGVARSTPEPMGEQEFDSTGSTVSALLGRHSQRG